MYILGLNTYHGDSSACLIKDGELVAALEEERIRRIKHWAGLPTASIRFCLAYAGINLKEVDYIAVAKDPRAHLWGKFLFALRYRPELPLISDRLEAFIRITNLADDLGKEFGIAGAEIKKKIRRVEHHLGHLASSFLVSPFAEAALVSVDGLGDFVSAMWGYGQDNKIGIFDYVLFPHSLGFFYTALTQYLGFWKYGDEYKVMGLSAFGEPEVYFDKLKDLVLLKKNGRFELNLKYFRQHQENINFNWDNQAPEVGKMFSAELEELLGPRRSDGEPLNERFHNIAAATQAVYEQTFFHILEFVYQKTRSESLCLAGGTIQNSLANGKIYEHSSFKKVYIPPAAYDAGNAVGAAFYLWNSILGNQRRFVMTSPFWGPEYADEEIKNLLNIKKLKYEYLDNEKLIKKTARLLADGKIVGWFQGRTEWGPRALGNRSILANPTLPQMKDILNTKIKKRESFRPFAPSVAEEAVGEYFSAWGGSASGGEQIAPVPFMEKVYVIKPQKRKLIPAVVHVDGTGRLQSVSSKDSPLYYDLIKEFGRLTKVPILLNTSFNENEPIVNRPEEAIDCFLRTRMDVLVLGNYLTQR